MKYLNILTTSISAAALVTTTPALAQSTTPEEKPLQLDEIVVTAQKRQENIIDVPISIAAVSGKGIEARGLRNVRDFQFTVPNVTSYGIGNFSPNIIVRGISSEARNIGFESSLGMYVDGVFLGRSDAYSADLEDIERVEILRGPQGTLFGKNTTSGAISVTTQAPGNTLSGFAIGEYGNYNNYRVSTGLSGPIVKDLLAAKISAYASGRDGYVKNINPGGPRDFDNDRARGVRGELRFTPTDDLTISLKGDLSSNRYRDIELESEAVLQNDFGVPEDSVAPGIRTVNVNGNSDGYRRVAGTSLTVEARLGDYRLTSISAYRDLQSRLNLDLDATSFDYLASRYSDNSHHFTQEVRLASPSGKPLQFVLGAFYFNQTANSVRDTIIGTATQNVLGSFGVPEELLAPDSIKTTGSTKTDSIAAYLDGSYAVTGKISFLFGTRFTSERKRLTVEQTSPLFLALPGVLLPDPIYLNVNPVKDQRRDTDLSPTVGVRFKLGPAANTYFRYSKGFKSGGWNAELLGPNADPAVSPSYFDVRNIRFAPESIENFELGLKGEFLDRKLRLSAAAFWMVYSDIQISRFVGGLQGYRTENAGKARSRGFEIEVSARPFAGLDLSGNLGYADARYIRYTNGCGDGCNLDGTKLNAPAWTAAAGAQYQFAIGHELSLLLRGDYAYRSERPGQGLAAERQTNRLPGFSTVDARIGLVSPNGWQLDVFARNIFDKAYYIYRGVGSDNALIGVAQQIGQYARPRTYGVRASYRF